MIVIRDARVELLNKGVGVDDIFGFILIFSLYKNFKNSIEK
ncbi:hypothetical protein WBZ18_03200 [Clostridium botulinum]|uniref:Uncharacterized protein n=1 Tax=Clostridium botulinum (strain 657 / Type Ba4) TaxID=515621 RepID=A0A3F2ZSD1_CLOB6|nr:hypothetical protein [Clostridium botulinum]ACQ54029.1 hypothetical protein CLJ_B2490 [Clostridium botulinum Ba4 str. 657]EDT84949.1 hypothetical protein CBB_2522 [Clostridium botulinum Bf]EPS52841.1 hypothetical protein CFSAN002368_03534 [Clostridium botulinum A1 str. CFSAN002368]